MKVILKQDIKGIGKKDEIHEVYRADSTAPIWLLPSPPLPLMTIIRCPLLLGIRQ